MPDKLTLPLRPLRRQKPNREDDLAIKIAQINAQRGSFRNVTEAGLLAEIEAARAAGKSEADLAAEAKARVNEDEDEKRAEKLIKSRLEISQFAMEAHMEATYALEFVSLLLSRYAPRQAEMSMSPLLKQKVPLGSLAADRTRPPQQSEAQKMDIEAVSRGWKLDSFDSAASKLLQSAERLQRDIAAETKYWSEVLKIKEQGWKVCRLPRERQTLGVHYGFLDAAPTFRDRGLAALRMAEGGKLVLDRGTQARPPRVVRVRVQREGRTVGVAVPKRSRPLDDESLEGQVREARDGLFEEELFYELNREARVLLPHGVETRRNLVQFPADDTREILIDMVGVDEPVTEGSADPSDTMMAEGIAQTLRLLLSHAHRRNHRRRSMIPPPMTPKRRPTPEYMLIRPILGYLQHRSHFMDFSSLFQNLHKTLQSAGLKFRYKLSPFLKRSTTPTNHPPPLSLPPVTAPSAMAWFIDTLSQPLESLITCTLLTPNTGLKIRLTTNVNPNGYGSEFEFITNLPHFPAPQSSFRFGLREDIHDMVLQLFTLDLVFLIPSFGGGSGGAGPNHKSALASMPAFAASLGLGLETGFAAYHALNEDADAQDDSGVHVDAEYIEDDGEEEGSIQRGLSTAADRNRNGKYKDRMYLLPWQPTSPQQGALTAYSPARQRSKKLQIRLSEDELRMECWWVGRQRQQEEQEQKRWKGKQGGGGGEMVVTWRAEDGDGAKMTLKEAVEMLGKPEKSEVEDGDGDGD